MKFGASQLLTAEYAMQFGNGTQGSYFRKVEESIMKEATKRSFFRWIHIIFGIPMIGYIYDSPSDTQYYAPIVRYFFLPVLLLSGLWMWKGHILRRLLSKKSANKTTGMKTGQELEA